MHQHSLALYCTASTVSTLVRHYSDLVALLLQRGNGIGPLGLSRMAEALGEMTGLETLELVSG
jgi:hypothetical protein